MSRKTTRSSLPDPEGPSRLVMVLGWAIVGGGLGAVIAAFLGPVSWRLLPPALGLALGLVVGVLSTRRAPTPAPKPLADEQRRGSDGTIIEVLDLDSAKAPDPTPGPAISSTVTSASAPAPPDGASARRGAFLAAVDEPEPVTAVPPSGLVGKPIQPGEGSQPEAVAEADDDDVVELAPLPVSRALAPVVVDEIVTGPVAELVAPAPPAETPVERSIDIELAALPQSRALGPLDIEFAPAEPAAPEAAESEAADHQTALSVADLAAETDFLRSELRRYQTALDEERVARASAVARARLENEQELDDLHREHRASVEAQARANRDLLAEQHTSSEAKIAALEAEHQRDLDQAHDDYEVRLDEVRRHLRERLDRAGQRADAVAAEARADEISQLQVKLQTALGENHRLQTRLDEALRVRREQEQAAHSATMALLQSEQKSDNERARHEREVRELTTRLHAAERHLHEERERSKERVQQVLQQSASLASQSAEKGARGQRAAEVQRDFDEYKNFAETRIESLEVTLVALRNRLSDIEDRAETTRPQQQHGT